jgi:hypothetical protein
MLPTLSSSLSLCLSKSAEITASYLPPFAPLLLNKMYGDAVWLLVLPHRSSMLTIHRTNDSKPAPKKENSGQSDHAKDTKSRDISDTISPAFELSSFKSCENTAADNNYSMQRFLAYDDDLQTRLMARAHISQPTIIPNG